MEYKSKCCDAPVFVSSAGEGMSGFVCEKCAKPCDPKCCSLSGTPHDHIGMSQVKVGEKREKETLTLREEFKERFLDDEGDWYKAKPEHVFNFFAEFLVARSRDAKRRTLDEVEEMVKKLRRELGQFKGADQRTELIKEGHTVALNEFLKIISAMREGKDV